ncbi:MAG: Gfo/Idh/MocA family oxidoreductase [Symploca sp. SIO1A3]|nr:Gfo/Idh/MocA family oxidoreductase [Symploca sp. SIO1A3]
MSKSKIRVGVVGIGFAQQVHVPAFRADERCEVVAICASNLARASKVAGKLDIPQAFGDWQELIAQPNIDVISIATPPNIQPEIAIAALSQGKGVFCEKPLATSAAAAQQMAAAAQQQGVANMVDLEFPEIELWQQAKLILERGELGKLRHVAVSWNVETYANRMGLDSWKTRIEAGGGVLNSFVSHSFYYLEWLLAPITRLFCSLFRTPGDKRTGDTLATLCLELESGIPVSLSVSSHAFLGNGHHLEFYGDAGTMILDNPTSDYVGGFRLLKGTRESKSLEMIDLGDNSHKIHQDGRITVVGSLVKRFVTWQETGIPDKPSFTEGLRVQQLLEAAQQSHQSGSWIIPSC